MNAVNSQHEKEHSWEASVSCWVDGESDIRAEELNSPYGRHLWDTYNLIGDVMRSSDLAINPSDRFYARLSAAIDAEPAILAPVSIKNKFSRMVFPGLAVVAVLSVVWIAQPLIFQDNSQQQALINTTAVLAKADEPVQSTEPTPRTIDPSLADYMAAHQAMAGVGPMHQVAYDLMNGAD